VTPGVAAVTAVGVAVVGWRARWLTGAGAAVATAVGTGVLSGGGLIGFILLGTFFVSGSALSLQGTPANQIIIGLSLFLTFFIMAPVWERIDREALEPYRAHQISSSERTLKPGDALDPVAARLPPAAAVPPASAPWSCRRYLR